MLETIRDSSYSGKEIKREKAQVVEPAPQGDEEDVMEPESDLGRIAREEVRDDKASVED